MQGVLVHLAVLHNHHEVPRGIFDEFEILQRVAIDEKQIGEGSLFDDAKLARIGLRNPERSSRWALSAVAILSTSADVYQRASDARIAPLRFASSCENRTSVPHAVLRLYFFASLYTRDRVQNISRMRGELSGLARTRVDVRAVVKHSFNPL